MTTTKTRRAPSPLAQSAAAIRSALAADVKVGGLMLSAGAKLSVRVESGSMYSCIIVGVNGAPERWRPAADRNMIPAANAVLDAIERRVRTHKISYAWAEIQVDGRTARSVDRDGWKPGED